MTHEILKSSLFAFTLAAGAVQAAECPPCAEPAASMPAAAMPPAAFYYTPWADLIRMRALLNEPFNPMPSLWMPVMLAPPPTLAMPTPVSTLRATGEGYRLDIPLPGFKEEDVKVTVEGRVLSISATTSTTEKVDGREQQSRRSFAETLTLPVAVQPGELRQHYENGVLTLTLPAAKPANGSV